MDSLRYDSDDAPGHNFNLSNNLWYEYQVLVFMTLTAYLFIILFHVRHFCDVVKILSFLPILFTGDEWMQCDVVLRIVATHTSEYLLVIFFPKSINYSQTIHLQLVTFSIQIIICGVKLYRTGNKCWCDKWVRCCGEMQEILIKCHSPSPRNEHLKTKNAFIVFVSERRNINSGRHWMKTSGNKIWRNLTPFLFASPRQKPLWNTPAVLLTEQNCPTQENQHQNIELKNQKLFRFRISLNKKNQCNSKEEKWNLFDFWMRLDPTPLSLMRG